MAEKTVPWWRRALQFALGGIRSGFGLFQRGAKPGDLGEVEPVQEFAADPSEAANRSEEKVASVVAQKSVDESLMPGESANDLGDSPMETPLPAAEALTNEEAASNLRESAPVEERIEAAEIEPGGVLSAEIEPAEIEGVETEPKQIEQAAAEMGGEAAERQEEVESPGEPMSEEAVEPEAGETEAITDGAVAVETIKESNDNVRAEELETVEAEATVVETRTNAPTEVPTKEVKAVEVSAEVPAGVEQSAEPAADHAEEPAPGEEPALEEAAEVHVAGAEEAVNAQADGAEIPESQDESSDEPGAIEAAVVEDAGNEEVVRAQAPDVAEAPIAEGMTEETWVAEHAEAKVEAVEDISGPSLMEAEVNGEPHAETMSGPEAGPEAGAEAGAEAPAAPTQMELIPKPEVDERAAAKKAAQEKRRKEAEEDSPFSVMVGLVYDGPLDLLLDLIRKQDIDIYDIPIAKITAQFLAYVNQLKASDVDVAGEFIYTASLLIHIKSKMLLPRTAEGPGETPEDPRRELVERLLEHERFKNAAQMLQQKQMMEAASWSNPGYREFVDDEGAEPEIAADTVDLVRVFREILERARNRPVLDVAEDTVTVGQMIQFLGRRLMMEDKPIALRKLLSHTRSERALIAMFLALLELVRLQAVLLRQDRQFSEIFIKKHAGFEAVMDEGLANARDDWR